MDTAKKAASGNVDRIQIRMYRPGTGDFFILQFKKGDNTSFNMMIDCGCINAGKEYFTDNIANLRELTGGTIDLLIVTHQHADHINGFQKCSHLWDDFTFRQVWFAWTEDDTDPMANDYRAHYSKLGMALNTAVEKLTKLKADGGFRTAFEKEWDGKLMLAGREYFIDSLQSLNELNPVAHMAAAAAGQPLPTMAELFRDYKVVKDDTQVEFLEPGDYKIDLPGAEGIRFYVLGPPRSRTSLNRTEAKGANYDQRDDPSSADFAFLSATGAVVTDDGMDVLPFDAEYEAGGDQRTQKVYEDAGNAWRRIDNDWLFSAGSLAMKYERSINNTSLALAIQFEDTERVLLFPGDAELGNWESWHNNLTWPVKTEGRTQQKDATYFLNHTVFYKVGHHLSHNGTAIPKGLDLMTQNDLTAMATLDFDLINKGWLNTMPNDLLGAELIRRTGGKIFFSGDCGKILDNIKTHKVSVKKTHENVCRQLHDKFEGKTYVDWEVEG